ncbi:E3 ubiquitin-protein ligase ZNF598 [Phymastichus coffea]|uniref:E3 ubiquitin-protein ligase ZNF598 n=1 Tax=Phymastichus coffea TaxID=108790 RepID=UPI00273BF8A7|nr:E3 ubiquitin-protein ligase ZNF598 [Phymastichus coffea]XP_058795285.1 E3 ubiquitin-protein ligase ZNF598 [Phymastichus coffea]
MSAKNETTTGSGNNNACIVCYKNTKYYSIGMCEHPVCYECSTRMRVLCQQNECPICRQDLPKVVFTKEIKPFRFLKKGSLVDTRYNIYFESLDIQTKFVELLAHRCTICENNQVFSSFNSLKEHMRRKHDLHYCDLCVENLKIFSNERRCYTKQELSHHRRKGDTDDKSHKGHPLCEFCDKRYMDNDELYRHLRRDHLFCHFCDADGLHHYYNSYDYLRDHFRQEHFLCEEGNCADEQFTSVFRTDIDLKAHKSSVHGKQLGKAAAKQARTLELEFTLAPRGDLRNRRPGPMRPHDGNANFSRNYQEPPSIPEEPPTFVRQQLVDVQSTQEFPTLGNATPFCPITTPKPRNVTIRSTLRQGNYDENFPALGLEASGFSSGPSTQTTKTLNLNVTSNSSQPTMTSIRRPAGTTNSKTLSVHVNHKPNGTLTTRVAGPNLQITPGSLRDFDFPTLGRVDPPAQSSWTKVTVKPSVTPRREKVAPPPLAPSPPPVQSDKAFPSLSKTKAPVTSTSWVQISSTSTNTNNSTSSTIDATKGKTKKKKKQQQTSISNGSASSTESSSSTQASKDTTNNDKTNTKSNKESEPSKKDRSKTKQNSDKSKKEETSSESVTVASTPRKRTEIKIENLNNTINDNNNISVETKTATTPKPEEFPVLGRRPPPGLTNPPPGFGPSPTVNVSNPPPGFFKRVNGLTFTNSSGESYAILSDSEHHYEYLPPADFQRRNQKLIAEFNNCFGSEESEELKAFRYLSGLFRTGICDADEYYQQCRTLMGVQAFNRVFPELLALLPDIDKQRKLFDVHKSELSGRIRNLDSCATCGQVLRSSDIPSHAASHSLENHFPVLGKTSSIGSGWHRK